jgi:hypothetical protein
MRATAEAGAERVVHATRAPTGVWVVAEPGFWPAGKVGGVSLTAEVVGRFQQEPWEAAEGEQPGSVLGQCPEMAVGEERHHDWAAEVAHSVAREMVEER